MNTEYKHGDKILVHMTGMTTPGHIEERFLSQWPEKRTGLYVCIDDGFPRFPIPIRHFQPENKEVYNYGTIKLA